MTDEDLEALLDDYLTPEDEPNPAYLDVQIIWIEGRPEVGVEHIKQHGVETAEVEEVIFRRPPEVEAKRCGENRSRTFFYGATRSDRWLFVACDDEVIAGIRYLTVITAFEPNQGREYWKAL